MSMIPPMEKETLSVEELASLYLPIKPQSNPVCRTSPASARSSELFTLLIENKA